MAHSMSAEDQSKILNAGYFEYIELGATHMLTGYDHSLFLFGVVFFLTRFNGIKSNVVFRIHSPGIITEGLLLVS